MKNLIKRILLVALSCAVSVGLAEVIIRASGVWIGRHSDTMFTVMGYDPVLGWKMKPLVQEKVSFVDVEGIPVRANSLGFWDREFALQKDSAKKRIAFLGDSMTWGLGVNESERFSNIVGSQQEFEALNFGIPGFGNDQELLVWRDTVAKYQPDIVVLTLYSNDYVDNMFVIRSGLRKPYFEMRENSSLQLREMAGDKTNFWTNGVFNEAAPPYATLFPTPVEKRSRVLHWLVKHSDLARLGYTMLRGSREAEQQAVSADQKGETQEQIVEQSDLGPTARAQVNLMDALVKQLAREVNSSGAQFLVVLAGDTNDNLTAQKDLLARAQINFIDMTTSPLAQKLSGGVKDLYFRYNKHWTVAGHRAVAGEIVAALKNPTSSR